MKNPDWTWIFPILIVIIVLIVAGMTAYSMVNGDEAPGKLTKLIDFCWDQLRPGVDNCASWAIAFREIYGDAPDECLELFDSDSALLLMCMGNLVE